VPNEYCYRVACFVPLDANTPKLFGFSEFLAALALMVLAWTIADVRYRFRVRTAPLPLHGLTFVMVGSVGVLALLTDLWRAEQWLVPRGHLVSPSGWQAILGGLFLLTFLTWAWFAFIRPPIYGRTNAKRYAQTLYRVILKGSPSELSVVADELSYSARSLIRYATDRRELGNEKQGEKPPQTPPKVTTCANEILLLIADKRFCRAIVDSSPIAAWAVFHELAETKKYRIPVGTFAKNIVNEALANKDSFLFHEAEGYESGLIGYHKPLSQAMFSNYHMVEVIGTLFDPDLRDQRKWDATQWQAYCRVVLMTFRDYVQQEWGGHSFALYRAMSHIEHAAFDVYKLDGITSSAWDDDIRERLRVVVEFIRDAIKILDEKGVPEYVRLRVREERGVGNFFDHLAKMILEVIFSAATVRSPADLCWNIQHNTVWYELFNFDRNNGPAGKVVKFKVRRLIYDEVVRMRSFPNFRGARILGFCLNVLGLTIHPLDSFDDSKALQKGVLAWTKRNYAWLHSYNPRLADACLAGSITYDVEHLRLVKTYPEGLAREPTASTSLWTRHQPSTKSRVAIQDRGRKTPRSRLLTTPPDPGARRVPLAARVCE
jgi:hypothetical protein